MIILEDDSQENSEVIADQMKEAASDKFSKIRSYKNSVLADKLIRNTYRTLLSRGQKEVIFIAKIRRCVRL